MCQIRWYNDSQSVKLWRLYTDIFFFTAAFISFTPVTYHSVKITKWQTPSQNISHFWLYAFLFFFYFRLLLLVEMENHSKRGSELNDTADGVRKVTQRLYVACSELCNQLLEKPDLTERINPGEVNYTGRASRSSHRRLKCDVINAGCRCSRRCLPFPTLYRFSLTLSFSPSLTPAQVRSYTKGKSRKNSMGRERTPLSTHYREGVRKTKNQGYQHHEYSTQNPLNH